MSQPLLFLLSFCLGTLFYAASSGRACAQESATGAPPPVSSPVLGWVEIEPVPGKTDHLTIIGKVYGLRECEGRYFLGVKRRERGSLSDGAQSGAFRVGRAETALLSRSTINVTPAASLEIVLKIQSDGHEIYSALLRPAP